MITLIIATEYQYLHTRVHIRHIYTRVYKFLMFSYNVPTQKECEYIPTKSKKTMAHIKLQTRNYSI